MTSSNKLSLQAAILININIMAGAGIFVNIVNLTSSLGVYSSMLYGIIGLIMFPLVYSFAQLVTLYPTGGLYAFAQPVNTSLGFISCWTYFFGKLASVALYLDVMARFTKKLAPQALSAIPAFWISVPMLLLYLALNCMNVKLGVIIQKIFVIAKSIPMILLIALGIYNFDITIFELYDIPEKFQFILMIPSILYCYSGFEAACSVSRNIINPEKNAAKAILYSFFGIISIYILFQTMVSMMLINKITTISDYTIAYPYLMSLAPVASWIQLKMATLISFMVTLSVMGAAYGILFSNNWNLYTLAQNNHVFGSSLIKKLNKHGIPTYAIATQGIICFLFLLITQANQIQLQQISAFSSAIAYTISIIALLIITKESRIIGTCALITCAILITSCTKSIINYNINTLYLFTFFILIGTFMYIVNNIIKNNQTRD